MTAVRALRAPPATTSPTSRCRCSTPTRSWPAGGRRWPRCHGRAGRRFSRVRLPRRRTPARRDVRQLRRRAAGLRPGHAGGARRRRQPAAAGVRQRGQRGRHRRVRRAASAARSSTPILHRERRHRAAGAGACRPAASAGRWRASRCSTRDDRPRRPTRTFGPDGRLLNADAATGELVNTPGAGAFAGYYNDPDADGRADARRHVLVRRPRLPGRRRLRLLRRPHLRLAARRTARTSRPRRSSGSCCATRTISEAAVVRRPRRRGRRPGDGGPGDHRRRSRRTGRSRRSSPISPTSPPRPGRATSGSPPPPPDRHQQGAQARAGRRGAGRRDGELWERRAAGRSYNDVSGRGACCTPFGAA